MNFTWNISAVHIQLTNKSLCVLIVPNERCNNQNASNKFHRLFIYIHYFIVDSANLENSLPLKISRFTVLSKIYMLQIRTYLHTYLEYNIPCHLYTMFTVLHSGKTKRVVLIHMYIIISKNGALLMLYHA